jgi:hypothetical protein
MSGKEDLVQEIVEIEWRMFQNVHNIGGPAPCQDDFKTFEIMRYSQAMAWSEVTLESYLDDLIAAEETGRNLVTEKYGRMMESTSPLEYARIKHLLPALDHEVLPLIDKIVATTLKWQEELMQKFPYLVRRGRPIHSSEDTLFVTSFETYLRGELVTYSSQTLKSYYQDVVNYERENENGAMITLEYTVKRYGYDSLEEADSKLANQN